MSRWLACLCGLWLCLGSEGARGDVPVRRVMKGSLPEGDFFWYAPHREVRAVLFVVHGSLSRRRRAQVLARKFLRRWRRFARKRGVLLIAPAFDRARYQSYGGYRGLFGRFVGADVFLDRILGAMRVHFPKLSSRFLLYGHSAGGQFVIRYCVRHPHRVLKAVASAPGRYAFPIPSAPWPYGMGRLRRKIRYRVDSHVQSVDVRPRSGGWLLATQLPLTVLVGTNDLSIQPKRPAHGGWTRVETAKRWVSAMARLALRHRQKSRIRLEFVPGVGHHSRRLTPAAQSALLRGSGLHLHRKVGP